MGATFLANSHQNQFWMLIDDYGLATLIEQVLLGDVCRINALKHISGGKCLAVLPLGDCGRKERTMPFLCAHSGKI